LCFAEGSQEILKENLIDELEYMLVPEEAWKKLVEWYNVVEGQVSCTQSIAIFFCFGFNIVN